VVEVKLVRLIYGVAMYLEFIALAFVIFGIIKKPTTPNFILLFLLCLALIANYFILTKVYPPSLRR